MDSVIDFDNERQPESANTSTIENTIEPEVRRGRGRPRKDGSAPGSERPGPENNTKGTAQPKRRKKGAATPAEVEDRAKAIAASHMAIAFLTQTPEIMLSQDETMALAQANLNLENEFDIAIDGKTLAIMTMIGTMASVYIKRVPVIVTKFKAANEKRKAEKAMKDNVEAQQ